MHETITFKKEKNYKKLLFLETTAQICRVLGHRGVEKSVENVIRKFCDNSEGDPKCRVVTTSIVYGEFLATIVTDILLVRDIVIEEFLEKDKFYLSLDQLEQEIGQSKKIQNNRAKRIFAVTSTLLNKFGGSSTIETRRVLIYLDSTARHLAIDKFFYINNGTQIIEIDSNSSCYLTGINCLTENPLKKDCQVTKNNKCRLKINESDPNDPNSESKIHSKKCFIAGSPITKCKKKPKEYCNIIDFFREASISKKINLLKKAAETKKFSPKFRNKSKNKKWIELIQKLDCSNNEFIYRGKRCYYYFFDMLILLQCPEDAFILSSDRDYEELGKAINRPDIQINFFA